MPANVILEKLQSHTNKATLPGGEKYYGEDLLANSACSFCVFNTGRAKISLPCC